MLVRCAVFGAILPLPGCAPDTQIHMVALNYENIDVEPRFVLPVRVNPQRCYWWTNESGKVYLAMEHDAPSIFGPAGRSVFQLVFTLEQPPAGRARNYLVAKQEMFAVARQGPARSRYTATSGIVALSRESGDRYRGSFRIQATREVNKLLGDWGRAGRYLLTGVFTATHDEQRGRRIEADARQSGAWPSEDESPQPMPSSANR
jgi:hypothetical protein